MNSPLHKQSEDFDPFRPAYHFSPPANWANDPNGMVYYAGEYHFFYQHHPHSTVWGPMHWGHAISKDLVHWEDLPIALFPDENGMIFSGSAVVDWQNTAGFGREALVLIYTIHKKTDSYHHQSQGLAFSNDKGRTWTKYTGNPVLDAPIGVNDIRDPKVFWYSENGSEHWAMALAVGDCVRFYTSKDLKNWKFGSAFGFEYGSHGGIWETPDLFKLPAGNSNQHYWVLTVGVGGGGIGGPAGGTATQYFIGTFNGNTFTSENTPETTLWADYGADYYAAQSWNDEPEGRRLMVGWMSNWNYALQTPTRRWRSMFSLPRELTLVQTEHGMRLKQLPVKELHILREDTREWHNALPLPGKNFLNEISGNCLEIRVVFEITSHTGKLGIKVRVGEEQSTLIGYDCNTQQLFIDRTHSGDGSFSTYFNQIHTASMCPVNSKISMQIFLDHCSVEVFGNEGLVNLSDLIFPSFQSNRLDFFCENCTIVVSNLQIHRIKPARFI